MTLLRIISALGLLLAESPSAWARNFLELESRYLGDGWFQYRVKVFADPFWQWAAVTLLSVNFTNRTEYGAVPETWTSDSSEPHFAAWSFNDPPPQAPAPPYERVFLVRSRESNFKTGLHAAFVATAASPQPEFTSESVSERQGFTRMACLVPCSPGEADGSPTNQLSTFEMVPDIKIDKLLSAGANIQGVAFSWKYPSTVLVQGSFDLLRWTNVSYALGSPPATNWTANAPLNAFGNYFRLRLIATDHRTNLVTGASANGSSSASIFDAGNQLQGR